MFLNISRIKLTLEDIKLKTQKKITNVHGNVFEQKQEYELL